MANFEEFDRRSRPALLEPQITLQTKGLFSMNPASYEALGKPEYIVLLMDPEMRVMAFKAAEKDHVNAYPVRRPSTGSRAVAVSGRAFCIRYRISLDKTITFPAKMQGDLLTVDLKPQMAK